MKRLLFGFALFAPLAFAQQFSPQAAQKLAQGTFKEYLELLALPNDAINPPDI